VRRFAAVAITSGAIVAGLAATTPSALASPTPSGAATVAQAGVGVAATTVERGPITGQALIAEAQRAGKPYSATEAGKIARASACGWYERTQGRRTSRHGRWLIYVKTRLTWCYNGSYITSARASYNAYTYNRRVFRWRGWAQKSLTHSRGWGDATTRVQGLFTYSGTGHTYRPYVYIRGYYNGHYRYWYGG
jgi:hypothetical protein